MEMRTDIEAMKSRLFSLGLMFPVSSGIQIDLNAVNRFMGGKTEPASLCDHNCTAEVGGYTCPAAFTLNKGIKPNFASGGSLLRWIETGHKGQLLARDKFLRDYFSDYCSIFKIPLSLRKPIAEILRSDLCEINLFGGNPEMHPEVLWLIRELKTRGFRVNLTTTGRRFLTSREFIDGFAKNPPHLLALSVDDFDQDQLEGVFKMPLEALRAGWKKINPLHGQRQKFIEGIYAARMIYERNIQTAVLFNMVLHGGNIHHARSIIAFIRHYLPKAIVNPYPAQDSFEGGSGQIFSEEYISEFKDLVGYFIEETENGNLNLTKRIQYWLVTAAVLEKFKDDPATASKFIAGHEIWQCYRSEPIPGAGMYLQIGKSGPAFAATEGNIEPGGYLNCYWTAPRLTTIAARIKAESAEAVSAYLLGGMQKLAQAANFPCPGCSMPRLWFDMVRTELGLHPGLREIYLRLRREHIGF